MLLCPCSRRLAPRLVLPLILFSAVGTSALAWQSSPDAETTAMATNDTPAPIDSSPAAQWASLRASAHVATARFVVWYRQAEPVERVSWGALVACSVLGVFAALACANRARRGQVIPRVLRQRVVGRFSKGAIDWSQALDYCELNPSPAARVSLAALGRWGAPAGELERLVDRARATETLRLRRGIQSLQRIALLAPLMGLLGTLATAARLFSAAGSLVAWGPLAASALAPLTTGVALAILSLVAYDGLSARIETLELELDQVGTSILDGLSRQPGRPDTRARADLSSPFQPHALVPRANTPSADD